MDGMLEDKVVLLAYAATAPRNPTQDVSSSNVMHTSPNMIIRERSNYTYDYSRVHSRARSILLSSIVKPRCIHEPINFNFGG